MFENATAEKYWARSWKKQHIQSFLFFTILHILIILFLMFSSIALVLNDIFHLTFNWLGLKMLYIIIFFFSWNLFFSSSVSIILSLSLCWQKFHVCKNEIPACAWNIILISNIYSVFRQCFDRSPPIFLSSFVCLSFDSSYCMSMR